MSGTLLPGARLLPPRLPLGRHWAGLSPTAVLLVPHGLLEWLKRLHCSAARDLEPADIGFQEAPHALLHEPLLALRQRRQIAAGQQLLCKGSIAARGFAQPFRPHGSGLGQRLSGRNRYARQYLNLVHEVPRDLIVAACRRLQGLEGVLSLLCDTFRQLLLSDLRCFGHLADAIAELAHAGPGIGELRLKFLVPLRRGLLLGLTKTLDQILCRFIIKRSHQRTQHFPLFRAKAFLELAL